MAIIRNTAAMRLKGSVGNTTYYTQGGRQLARVSQNSTNYGESARRSPAQQTRRVKWSNLVSFYKISENWIHGAFESKSVTQSDYNKFMSVNLPAARIALNKDEASVNACVLDEFIVSMGSLKSFDITRTTGLVHTGLTMRGHFEANMPVSDFSKWLIFYNPYLSYGMQISLVVYEQIKDSFLFPKVLMGRYELTLDKDDARQLDKVWDGFAFSLGTDGSLDITGVDDENYVTVILSDSTSGSLKVSTQRLVKGDDAMATQYSTNARVKDAIDSYGVDQARFLDSGDE